MPRVEKALQHAYKARRLRPRFYRRDWISAICAGTREHGIPYSQFIYGLTNSNIQIDRKILANLAANEPYSFKAIVDEVKVQAELKTTWRDDMDFVEAIDKNYLVYGPVIPLPPASNFTIPYLTPRTAVPEAEKGRIRVVNSENWKEISKEK